MTQVYCYPEFIDKENAYSDDSIIEGTSYERRNILRIPFKKMLGSKALTICFIMKNPSAADGTEIDKTVSNVIRYVSRLRETTTSFRNITEIVILNLYSLYSTQSPDLLGIMECYGEEMLIGDNNDAIIRDWVARSSIIVPSWGHKPKNFVNQWMPIYRNRVYKVINDIRESGNNNIFLIGERGSRKLYPRHPERIGYVDDDVLRKYMLQPYRAASKWFVRDSDRSI